MYHIFSSKNYSLVFYFQIISQYLHPLPQLLSCESVIQSKNKYRKPDLMPVDKTKKKEKNEKRKKIGSGKTMEEWRVLW